MLYLIKKINILIILKLNDTKVSNLSKVLIIPSLKVKIDNPKLRVPNLIKILTILIIPSSKMSYLVKNKNIDNSRYKGIIILIKK